MWLPPGRKCPEGRADFNAYMFIVLQKSHEFNSKFLVYGIKWVEMRGYFAVREHQYAGNMHIYRKKILPRRNESRVTQAAEAEKKIWDNVHEGNCG